MIVGIPVLVNYTGLRRLIESIERGSVQPELYMIIDNGGALPGTLPVPVGSALELVLPDRNCGVAASWNDVLQAGLDHDLPVVISNDDVVFGETTLEEMVRSLETHPFVEGEGWALFGQTPGCTKQVGFYDENFFPAYHEDVDYDLRLAKESIPVVRALSFPVRHDGWSTTKQLGYPEWLDVARDRGRAYFVQKWGSDSRNPRWNGHPGLRHYDVPFDGATRTGLDFSQGSARTPLLHEVLNYLSLRLNARSYLHVGAETATGRRVVTPQKVRVDHAADAPAGQLFDLILIDGDHEAKAVLTDFMHATARLALGGVIVLHDTNPHSEDMQEVPLRRGHQWTGDAWKAVAELREQHDRALWTIPSDYGISLYFGQGGIELSRMAPLRETWADLERNRQHLLGLDITGCWQQRIEASLRLRSGSPEPRPRLWDCFLFHDELDLLEMRLTELSQIVHRFVLVESTKTFQGKPKPLVFQQHRERFALWMHRIVHVVVEPKEEGGDPWANEAEQREAIGRGLLFAAAHDVVLLSDVDEIPHPAKIAGLAPREGEVVALEMRMHPFAVDWEHPRPWRGTLAARLRDITSFQKMRDQRDVTPSVVPDAGHHFTWLGEPGNHLSKLDSFAHTDLPAEVRASLEKDRFFSEGKHVDGVPLRPVAVDFTYPLSLQERRMPRRWYRQPKKEVSAPMPAPAPLSVSPNFNPYKTSTWAEVWPAIDSVEGWLTEKEARALYELARKPDVHRIVELGSYKGRSAAALACGWIHNTHSGERPPIWAVDLWKEDEALRYFKRRRDELGLTGAMYMARLHTAAAAFDWRAMNKEPLDLVFIDADHSYEGCRADFEAWAPLVRPGGFVAFHDNWAPGPSQVLRELPGWFQKISERDSLTVVQKK